MTAAMADTALLVESLGVIGDADSLNRRLGQRDQEAYAMIDALIAGALLRAQEGVHPDGGGWNPYLDIVRQLEAGSVRDTYLDSMLALLPAEAQEAARSLWALWSIRERYYVRAALVSRFSWAIPDEAALTLLARHAPLIEVGAGTGYWARCNQERGVVHVATDAYPPDCCINGHHHRTYPVRHDAAGRPWGGYAGAVDARGHPLLPLPPKTHPADRDWEAVPTWVPVQQASVEVLAQPAYRDHTLFLCWPPGDDPFGAEALAAYRGDTLLYCGEWGGTCGDDAFVYALDHDWVEDEDARVYIPQWSGMHDCLRRLRRVRAGIAS